MLLTTHVGLEWIGRSWRVELLHYCVLTDAHLLDLVDELHRNPATLSFSILNLLLQSADLRPADHPPLSIPFLVLLFLPLQTLIGSHNRTPTSSMADESGATPRELLIEACRRNNTSLLTELLASKPFSNNATAIAKFLNATTDALGASALHIAAQHGSYEVLDTLLDQEDVEIDGQEKREGDTCLHKAVRFANEQRGEDEVAHGRAVVDILVDAGCDPRYMKQLTLSERVKESVCGRE